MRRLTAELIAPVGALLGEGPTWDERSGQLHFVDILRGTLYVLQPSGHVEILLKLDTELGAALPAQDPETVLLITRTGFASWRSGTNVQPLLNVYAPESAIRFNDAKCDPAGRCFAGSLPLGAEPATGELVRLDPGPTATTVVGRVGLSNGLGWSPDGRALYFVDTTSGAIDQFDYDLSTGELGGRRPFVAEPPGAPDGLCVDDDGGVWVARWAGGTVHRFTPDGRLDTIVELPVPHATSCAFGGPDGRTLYITTACHGLDPDELAQAPHSGDLFAAEPGVSGPAASPWRPVEVHQ